jgi:hypothetical protein
MTEAEFKAYMKHEFTQEEVDERRADLDRIWEELKIANEESPLPDDFIDYVKGRKFRPVVAQ